MNAYPKEKIQDLCARLEIEADFFMECLEESVIEVREADDHLDLGNGSVLRLRRLQRICHTLSVEPPVAVLLNNLLKRVADLQKALARNGDILPNAAAKK